MNSKMIQAGELFDWASVEPLFQKLLEEDLTPERVPEWLLEWSELEKELWEAQVVSKLDIHKDTTDERAIKAHAHFIENVDPHHNSLKQKLTKKLLDLYYEPLAEHEQMFKRFRTEVKLFREENIAVQKEISTLLAEYYKHDTTNPDRKDIFLRLLKLRRKMAHNAGFGDYRSYRWQELKRFDYTPQDSLEFIDAIAKEVIPLLKEKRWQNPNDLEVGHDYEKPFATVKDLENGLERIFTNLDPILGKQFGKMRDGWLDIECSSKKATTAYCDYFPKQKMPYIFSNQNRSRSDEIWLLLHEMGHAFHWYAMGDIQPLVWNNCFFSEINSEFSEIASQAMELIALPYLQRERWLFQ